MKTVSNTMYVKTNLKSSNERLFVGFKLNMDLIKIT